MWLNVFQTKSRINGEIARINKKLARRNPKKTGDLEISGVRIKELTRDKDIIYQIFGRIKNISFTVNVRRFWTNAVEDDVERFEGCSNLTQFYKLNQKA